MKAQLLTEYSSVRIVSKSEAEEIFGDLNSLEQRPFPWDKACSVDGEGELEATVEFEGEVVAYSDAWEGSEEDEGLCANNSFLVVDGSGQVAIFDDEAETVASESDPSFDNLADNWSLNYAPEEEDEEHGRQHLRQLLKEHKVIILHM